MIESSNVNAERAVLGAMLISPQAVDKAMNTLQADHFTLLPHRNIFTAIKELWLEPDIKEIDVMMLKNHPKAQLYISKAGGIKVLMELSGDVLSAANVSHYINEVYKCWQIRYFRNHINQVHDNMASKGIHESIEELTNTIIKIQGLDTKEPTMEEYIDQAYSDLINTIDNKDYAYGLKTGFHDFDSLTKGLKGGEMIVIGGRPSMGKTAFAMNIVEHVCINQNIPTLVYSMEMHPTALYKRLFASLGELCVDKITTDCDEYKDLLKGINKIIKVAPLYIDGTSGLTASSLYARTRKRLMQGQKIGLIVLDYIQLCNMESDNLNVGTSNMSKMLKQIAVEYNIPIIVLSQLNRESDKTDDHMPILSNLRDSGAIEQDADIVCFVHRDFPYLVAKLTRELAKADSAEYDGRGADKKTSGDKAKQLAQKIEDERFRAMVKIAKNRNGEIGTVFLDFCGDFTKFYNNGMYRNKLKET